MNAIEYHLRAAIRLTEAARDREMANIERINRRIAAAQRRIDGLRAKLEALKEVAS